MKRTLKLAASLALALWAAQVLAQAPVTADAQEPWSFQLITDGYVVPSGGYVSPTLSADRGWLHLEARYNYENLRTGSLWAGYNFEAGKTLVLDLTPMIGGVFGRTTGIAPGCEASLTYKKVELSVATEYVFDTGSKAADFYYSWPQLTYSPLAWLKVGLVAQHTKAYQTSLDIQRGFLVGVSHKKVEFTTYIFNVGESDPTVVLEIGFTF